MQDKFGYIEQKDRKKILLLCDDIRLHSGVATMAREIVVGTSHHFNWVNLGGAMNHRMGLDDAVMIKDNHIVAAGGIGEAVTRIRSQIPYPLTIEVETENLAQVREALQHKVDIIMLDNMPLSMMSEAVLLIREEDSRVKIEASGNVTLETVRAVAETGVDYISTSAPITQSKWLDLSMRMV